MTDQATETPAQSLNGSGPPPAAEACEDCVSGAEQVMGVIGTIVGLGVLLIGIDLLTGGALMRLFGLGESGATREA